MDLKVIPTVEVEREDISLRSLRDKPKEKPIQYEAEKFELSKNIQKFEKRVKVYTENPYSYNAVALRKDKPVYPTLSADQLIVNPLYSSIGRFLGVDMRHDWSRYSDKVHLITEWAINETGNKRVENLMAWISKKAKTLPKVREEQEMPENAIDNLYLFAKLALNKK